MSYRQVSADLRVCEARLAESERVRRQLAEALRFVLESPRWVSIGSIDNTADLRRVSRERYEGMRAALAVSDALGRETL